ncbi:MAG: hypothetical protein J7623_29310 [Chitinophaga sp.]|uniref:hypothetical protein n=1 Tax=Chitinophaga sp. TaxID=1869181 RepID=UPI001B1BEFC5|nr:hypothetical protein [Chitinophaga sp.]MBO9732777.1 hypothetical protein [Chitinophaga sp.]
MKSWFLIACLLTVTFTHVYAQNGAALLSKGGDGHPVFEKSYIDVQGSPYLQDDWAIGNVDLVNGKAYKGVALKYDQVKDQVLFKNDKDEMNVFTQPVKSFTINNRKDNSTLLYRNGFTPLKNATEASYYQVLADGQTQLLTRIVKKIRDDKAYNSATTVRTIDSYQCYFIAKGNTPVLIKKSDSAVLEALGSNIPALKEYIRKERLNVKNDADLAKLIAYYNTLEGSSH